jgi:hypothetical protein
MQKEVPGARTVGRDAVVRLVGGRSAGDFGGHAVTGSVAAVFGDLLLDLHAVLAVEIRGLAIVQGTA